MGCNTSQSFKITQSQVKLTKQQIITLIQSKDYRQAEKIADIFFKQKSYSEAILIYQQIIQNNLDRDYQIKGLGNSQLMSGLVTQKVYQYYENIFKQKQGNKNPYDALSLCYFAIRQKDEQISKGIIWFQKHILNAQNYQMFIGYANLLNNSFQFDLAITMYKRAISNKSNIINAYISLAFIYQFYRKDKQSLNKMVSNILSIESDNMYAMFIQAKNNQIQVKIKTLQTLFNKFPSYARILNEIGLTYTILKQYNLAIIQYKKCINLLSKYANPYYNIAAVFQLQNKNKQACHWYLRTCEQSYNFHQCYYNLAALFKEMKFEESDIVSQIQMYPKIDKFQYIYNIGLAQFQLKYYNSALKSYGEALKIKKDYRVYNSLGLVYDSLEKTHQCIKSYQKCIELNPSYCLPYYNLGIYYRKHQKIQMSIKNYQKALQLNPHFYQAYNNLGNIYSLKSQTETAVKYYKNAINYNSSYTLAHTNLMVCYQIRGGGYKALLAFNKAKEHFPNQAHRLPEKSKTYIKNNIEKCNRKWKGFSLIHSSSQPIFKSKPEIYMNQDDQIGLNYRKHPYPSIQQKRFIPYRLQQ